MHTLNTTNATSSQSSEQNLPSTNALVDAALKVKAATNSLLEIVSPTHIELQGAVAESWQAIHNHFSNSDVITSLDELNTISTIIHKITCSNIQLNSIKNKLCNPIMDKAEKESNESSTMFDPFKIARDVKEKIGAITQVTRSHHKTASEVIATTCQRLRSHLATLPPLATLISYSSVLSKMTHAYCQNRLFEIELYHIALG